MSVRQAILTTSKITGCPNLKVPAQTLFYQSRADYSGQDHVVYEVTLGTGEVAIYDITVEVKPGPKPPIKGKDTDL